MTFGKTSAILFGLAGLAFAAPSSTDAATPGQINRVKRHLINIRHLASDPMQRGTGNRYMIVRENQTIGGTLYDRIIYLYHAGNGTTPPVLSVRGVHGTTEEGYARTVSDGLCGPLDGIADAQQFVTMNFEDYLQHAYGDTTKAVASGPPQAQSGAPADEASTAFFDEAITRLVGK